MKEYAALVKEVRREGGDFIKIMTTGIMDFDTDGSITGTVLSFGEVRRWSILPMKKVSVSCPIQTAPEQ